MVLRAQQSQSGLTWIWISASCVAMSVLAVVLLLAYIAYEGMRFFWLPDVVQFDYQTQSNQVVPVAGILWDKQTVSSQLGAEKTVYVFKVANRRINGLGFRNYRADGIQSPWRKDPDIMLMFRQEWGDFIGYVDALELGEGAPPWVKPSLHKLREVQKSTQALQQQITQIEKREIARINRSLHQLKLRERRAELDGEWTPAYGQKIAQQRTELLQMLAEAEEQIRALTRSRDQYQVTLRTIEGTTQLMPLAGILSIYQPNAMSVWQKSAAYGARIWEFLTHDPREANTEGGVLPAIFGTVAMVFIMTLLVTPFGVIAAVYLHEYAANNWLSKLVRVAVNNLAGVPSVVFGVFGLGFFVYLIGGKVDEWFYPEALPSPTFGTPGLLWASATMALLTLPVVIVSTEEGLARVGRSLREGSLALGANRFETLWNLVLPIVSPAILTGMILAIARAAGEVAPLMLVGAVKLAPTLPIDGQFPFVHLERKFMHLGFHIFDVGFQSPNVEAARPLVFATSLLLVLLVVALNLSGITIRNRLRERFRSLDSA